MNPGNVLKTATSDNFRYEISHANGAQSGQFVIATEERTFHVFLRMNPKQLAQSAYTVLTVVTPDTTQQQLDALQTLFQGFNSRCPKSRWLVVDNAGLNVPTEAHVLRCEAHGFDTKPLALATLFNVALKAVEEDTVCIHMQPDDFHTDISLLSRAAMLADENTDLVFCANHACFDGAAGVAEKWPKKSQALGFALLSSLAYRRSRVTNTFDEHQPTSMSAAMEPFLRNFRPDATTEHAWHYFAVVPANTSAMHREDHEYRSIDRLSLQKRVMRRLRAHATKPRGAE